METLIRFVDVAFEVYYFLIMARIVLSWLPVNFYNPVLRFIYETTEPYLAIFRRIIPPLGMFDLSPIVAFFVLGLLHRLIISMLLRVAY